MIKLILPQLIWRQRAQFRPERDPGYAQACFLMHFHRCHSFPIWYTVCHYLTVDLFIHLEYQPLRHSVYGTATAVTLSPAQPLPISLELSCAVHWISILTIYQCFLFNWYSIKKIQQFFPVFLYSVPESYILGIFLAMNTILLHFLCCDSLSQPVNSTYSKWWAHRIQCFMFGCKSMKSQFVFHLIFVKKYFPNN